MDTTDETHIRRAIALAREAADRGDNPFGSVLVHDGEVLAEARNAVVTDDDVTAHPELRLARVAGRADGRDPTEMTLYTSTEPCPMCSGALYHAGIERIVFSASAADIRELVGPGLLIPCRDLYEAGTRDITVDGPLCQAEGRQVHKECW